MCHHTTTRGTGWGGQRVVLGGRATQTLTRHIPSHTYMPAHVYANRSSLCRVSSPWLNRSSSAASEAFAPHCLAMRPTMLLAAVAWALLGLAALLPGADAQTICPNSPYNMDGTKTSSDLNAVLASWNNNPCNGTITFTASTAQTYQLTSVTMMPGLANWTLDGSGSGGTTIVAAFNRRIIDTWIFPISTSTSLTLRSLTFKGNGNPSNVTNPDGGGFVLSGPSLSATNCTFENFRSNEDGGAIFICFGRYV